MNSTTKIITGIVVASGIVLGSSVPLSPTITIDELTTLNQIYNHEVQVNGGQMNVTNISPDDALSKINQIIVEREPAVDEEITINGQELTPTEYKDLRTEIFDKVEPESLLEELID